MYGGNTYRALVAHSSTVFATNLASSNWEKFNGGVRWRGTWATSTDYLVGDIVKQNVSSYIALADHTSGTFTTDLTAVKWELFAEGGDYVLPATTGNAGKFLSTDGISYTWDDVEANTIPFYPDPTASTTWSTGGQRFSYQTLTVASGVTYTISGNGFHYVLSSDGLVAFS